MGWWVWQQPIGRPSDYAPPSLFSLFPFLFGIRFPFNLVRKDFPGFPPPLSSGAALLPFSGGVSREFSWGPAPPYLLHGLLHPFSALYRSPRDFPSPPPLHSHSFQSYWLVPPYGTTLVTYGATPYRILQIHFLEARVSQARIYIYILI